MNPQTANPPNTTDQMASIYDYPEIYDAVMRAATEQLDAEIHVIHTLLQERNISKGRILEIGSGTSPHGVQLAQKGHTISGIDLSRPMITYAKNAAREARVQAHYIQANWLDFDLKSQPFDGAIFMAETFTLITEYNDIVNHFRAVRRHLKQGAFYLLDIDGQQTGYCYTKKTWGQQTIVLPNGHIDLWYEDHPADWVHGINRLTMHSRIHTQAHIITTADHWHIRHYNPWVLSLLIQNQPGWQLKGFYTYHNRSENIATEDNYFMLLEAV